MLDPKTEEATPEAQEVVLPSLPAVTDQQKEIASQALAEFERGNYDMCCAAVNKLINARPTDTKVLHNKIVAEYYQSAMMKTDELKQNLASICQLARINADNAESLEDVDHSIFFYNQAIISYHTRQYQAALDTMDRLFHVIEPLEESLSKKLLLLLVELYLRTYQPEKAMGMLTYIEKTVFSKGSATPDKGDNKNDNSKDTKDAADSNASVNDAWKLKISLYKTRCLVMMKSLKSCKREIKYLSNIQNMPSSFIFLKGNFEYLRGNHRKAYKMLQMSPPTQMYSEAGECLPVVYYNNYGCIHFHLRKHHLGALNFRKAFQENETALKDVRKNMSGRSSLSGCPLQKIGISRHYELLYNMGIQQLHCGKPLAAFDCLIEAVQRYQVNARLWFRLAECCIMVHKESNDDDRKLKKRMQVVEGSVGSGVHRKLILGPSKPQKKPSNGSSAIPVATLEFAALCLKNALMLIPADPLSVPSPPLIPPSEDQGENSKPNPETLLVLAPPGNPMRASEVANLRCSILAACAYVSLCLNDPEVALKYTENLLQQPRLSGAQKYTGHLYMAEALVRLDKIGDGIQHLNPDTIVDISTCPPEHKSEQEKLGNEKGDKNEKDLPDLAEAKGALYPWCPRDLRTAKALMQYNLSAAYALRGEFGKASFHLAESSKHIGPPLPAQMYSLKLYLDLYEGNRKSAQYVIKEYFGHVTPNRVEMKANPKSGANWNEPSMQ